MNTIWLKRLVRLAKFAMSGVDTADFPVQQISYHGKDAEAFVLMPYGSHANIPAEYVGIQLLIQGNAEARVIIPTSFQTRIKPLVDGEVVYFHPPTGTKIHFKENGDVEIVSIAKVIVTSPTDVQVTAATIKAVAPVVELGDGSTLRKLIDERFVAIFNAHTHVDATGGPEVPLVIDTANTVETKAT